MRRFFDCRAKSRCRQGAEISDYVPCVRRSTNCSNLKLRMLRSEIFTNPVCCTLWQAAWLCSHPLHYYKKNLATACLVNKNLLSKSRTVPERRFHQYWTRQQQFPGYCSFLEFAVCYRLPRCVISFRKLGQVARSISEPLLNGSVLIFEPILVVRFMAQSG